MSNAALPINKEKSSWSLHVKAGREIRAAILVPLYASTGINRIPGSAKILSVTNLNWSEKEERNEQWLLPIRRFRPSGTFQFHHLPLCFMFLGHQKTGPQSYCWGCDTQCQGSKVVLNWCFGKATPVNQIFSTVWKNYLKMQIYTLDNVYILP